MCLKINPNTDWKYRTLQLLYSRSYHFLRGEGCVMKTFNLVLWKVLILQKNTAGLRECQRMWVVWLCLICWYPWIWIGTECNLAVDLDKLIFPLITKKKRKRGGRFSFSHSFSIELTAMVIIHFCIQQRIAWRRKEEVTSMFFWF